MRAHRMVTLTGAGGVGKTQTALHVASSIVGSNDVKAYFVALAPITRPEQVVATIASTLGVQEAPDRPLLETVIACIRKEPLLIVLDNCEHVIGEAAIVADALLTGCPALRVLATSRESLQAAGEYSYGLPALRVPSAAAAGHITADDASAFGSIVLFCDRGNAVDQRFTLSDENARTIAEICRRLDGIPLAIELAAARLSQLSVESIARRLDDRFQILTRGSRNALPRQQTMRATIEWSYNLLSEHEQRVFERFSIFAGGSTIDMAMRVCGEDDGSGDDVFEALTSLVAKSLLTADSEGYDTRYVLLESFRQYAAAKLAERADADSVALRHAHAYYDLAHRTDPDPFASANALSSERIEQERDNWRAALHWTLIERRDILLGQRIAAETCSIWNFLPLEGRRWIDLATSLVDARTPAGTIADLNFAKAIILWYGNCEFITKLDASRRAAAYYRSTGNASRVARSLALSGHA
ncbi:MAG TPA: hypothetical protein VN936_00145, partial [Candidatus Acidoferrum sp.]|nr:hypothetical protein [Candidatus Acidoferrum sp.]